MHGNGESSGVAGGLSLGMARHAETTPDAAVRPGDTNPVSPTDEGRMRNWNNNFEVMLEGRPELRQELARYQIDAMVPMVQIMEWLRQFAGVSESILTHSRAQGDRLRGLETQVDALERSTRPIVPASIEVSVKVADLPLVVEKLALARDMQQALADFVAWHGPAHEPHCSMDDTCDCRGKELTDRVNSLLEGYKKPLDQPEPGAHPDDCTGCAACETAGA